MITFVSVLRHRLAAFRRSQDGNVALLFGLTLIPIIGLTGAAIDYNRASVARSAMQSALDATALAMSKDAATLSPEELSAKAAAYFAASFNRPEANHISVSAVYSPGGGNGSTVTVSGEGSIPSTFLGIMGINNVPIGSTSKTTWGSTRLRVALVLDNTGSMDSNNKMTALKTAAKKLLTQLENTASHPGDVYVSIIPFSKDVNVGSSNVGAGWLDWRDWDKENGRCSDRDYDSKRQCERHDKVWTPREHTRWEGCVTDREEDYDITNAAPAVDGEVVSPTPLFPAEQYSSCDDLAALMPMSYDWTALSQKIDEMTPTGNTNQPIGLAWGWMSLTDGAPLNTPPKDPDYKYQDVVILLTDGENTESRKYNDADDIDARQRLMCTNMKAANITIYTVLVMAGNASLLRTCASSSSNYFALTSADQIITAFDAIGTNLSKLRIAQ